MSSVRAGRSDCGGMIHSLLAGGSLVHGGFDQYSDLNFVVVVDPLYYDEIMAQRIVFAGTLGHLLHAFTGEHVGEPRLLSHAESRSPGLKGFGLFRPPCSDDVC